MYVDMRFMGRETKLRCLESWNSTHFLGLVAQLQQFCQGIHESEITSDDEDSFLCELVKWAYLNAWRGMSRATSQQ